MSGWNKISLFKFQQIEAINGRSDIPDIDKVLFSACTVFNLTEYQLDNAGIRKATKLVNKVNKIFSSTLRARVRYRIGKYVINYDISKATYGQFVELAFFLDSKPPVQNAHYILASLSKLPLFKYNSRNHRKRAEYFLKRPVTDVTAGVALAIERFKAFVNEYKPLFGLDSEVNGNEAQSDPFNKRYGWIYSASVVAEYERVTLDQIYALPVRQVLNDLVYLKALDKYNREQFEKRKLKLNV